MYYENLKIYIERAVWGDAFNVHIGARMNESTKFCVAQPIQYVERENNAVQDDPCLKLSKTDAQNLMDALWSVGLRPSEGAGSAGAMAAVQAHLVDMRRLVFERSQLSVNPMIHPSSASAAELMKSLSKKSNDDEK